jgi:glycosyltransferase involved in cell wall biosynthesis
MLQHPAILDLNGVNRAQDRSPLWHWRRFMTDRVARLETPVLRAVDAVQVENSWMLKHVRQVTDGHGTDVRFAAPGVDTTVFQPDPAITEMPGYILAVGRMADPRKNHMLLLRSYKALCANMDNPPRLALAGPDVPTPEFSAETDRLGLSKHIDIHTLLPRDALARLFRGAVAYVSTSDEEGFGITIIEAMASGIPPVATRSGGPQDIIDDGVDGFLVDLGDAETLANRLHRVITSPELRSSMAAAARLKVLARYDRDVAAEAFVEVIETLLAKSGKQAPS